MTPTDTPCRIAVTGASRGLGLSFCQRWLAAGHQVFALARQPDQAAGLAKLERQAKGRLTAIPCDVTDDAAVAAAFDRVGSGVDGLDLLVNNAGAYGARDARLEEVDWQELHRVFEVNAVGPLRVTRAFLPLLRRGRSPRVVHVTSLMGSIADNSSGGSYPYRLSKVSLNMASRNLAHELRPAGIVSAVIHPGWVQTDMGGAGAPLSIDDSVAAMVRTIDSFTLAHSGRFFDRDGRDIEW